MQEFLKVEAWNIYNAYVVWLPNAGDLEQKLMVKFNGIVKGTERE